MRKALQDRIIRVVFSASVIATLGLLAGCSGNDTAPAAPTATQSAAAPKINYGDTPGLPVDESKDPKELANLIARQSVHPRRDPFALSPQEMSYVKSQTTERLLQQSGNMETMYVPPPPPDDTPRPMQAQPYRRVSGILVGDSVVAIIEMGDGKPPVIVRPGQAVGDTGWFVVSIDEEKVVLRRGGNVQPTEVIVRLEQRPPGMGGGSGGGPGAGPGSGPPGAGPGTSGTPRGGAPGAAGA